MMHLKDNLKNIRKIRDKTQAEFAEILGVSLAMQKSYEGGKAKPDNIYLDKLSRLSGFGVSELINSQIDISEIAKKVEKVEKANNEASSTTKNNDDPDLKIAVRELSESINRHSITDERNSRTLERLVTLLEIKYRRELEVMDLPDPDGEFVVDIRERSKKNQPDK
jgi:transcriptional regulator with XRE-family HTH domain